MNGFEIRPVRRQCLSRLELQKPFQLLFREPSSTPRYYFHIRLEARTGHLSDDLRCWPKYTALLDNQVAAYRISRSEMEEVPSPSGLQQLFRGHLDMRSGIRMKSLNSSLIIVP
jgi:hypothetical protein